MIGFEHSLWLLGLASLAVPLLLHLFSRKATPPKDFPPAVLLVRDGARRISARHLKDLALLLARMALLALLVLVFVRVRLPQRAATARRETVATALVLVVDDSVSMTRRWLPTGWPSAVETGAAERREEQVTSGAAMPDRSTRLQRALLEARGALERLGPGSEAAAIFASGRSVGPCEPWQLSARLQKLATGRPETAARSDMGSALRAVPRFIAAMKPLPPAVLLFSDCERGAFEPEQVEQLRKAAGVSVVDLGEPGCGDDWSLPGARLDRERLVAGEDGEFLVRVARSPGAGAAATRRLELVLGEVAVAWRTVSLSPGAEAEVPLRFSVKSGVHLGELRLSGEDAWRTNDRLPVAVVAGAAARVAVICARERLTRAGRSVRLALSAGPGEERKAFLAGTFTPGSAELSSLGEYRAFVLIGPPRLETEVLTALARRVADGAGMVVFAEEPGELGRLAVPLGLPVPPSKPETVRFPDGARLVPERAGFRLFGSFSPALRAGVFRRGLQLETGRGTVLARLRSASKEVPGVTEHRMGRGLVLLVASSPSAHFSDLARRDQAPLLVPLLHELTARAAGLTPAEILTSPGETVQLSVTSRERSARFWLYASDGLKSPLGSPGPGLVLDAVGPRAPGAYRLASEADGQTLAVRPLSVRYPGSELSGARPADGCMAGGAPGAVAALEKLTRPLPKGTELTAWLALAGLLLLSAESVLSFAARARPQRIDDDLPADQKRGRAAG